MSLLFINVILGLGWCAMNGDFSMTSLVVGFIMGYICLWIVHALYTPTRYFSWLGALLYLAGLFIYELVKSNLIVLKQVFTPELYCRPAIIAIPLDVKSNIEITLLANLITLTPGTLSLHVSEDRSTIFVHTLFADDMDAVRHDIKDGFERRILEVTR